MNVITCVDLAQCGSRSTAVELLWLVSSWMTTAATAIYSTFIPSLRDAGAIRRVPPSTEEVRSNMKKFLTTLATVHEDAWSKLLTNQLLRHARRSYAVGRDRKRAVS